MVAAEDRTVWFGGCRRPLGGRSVRHSVDLVGSGEVDRMGCGVGINGTRALQERRYYEGGPGRGSVDVFVVVVVCSGVA